jgi:very-short-patch-repair endonuclease
MTLDTQLKARLADALARVPHGVLSHQTAAYLHGLTPHLPARVHVSIPHGGGRFRVPDVQVHQSLALDSVVLHDLPVTSLASTTVNVASDISDPYASRGLVYRAVFERGLDVEVLSHRALMAQKNGKAPVVRATREIKAGAWSVPEGVLWTAHVELGLPIPTLNAHVHTRLGSRYVDLMHMQYGVGIEVDGREFHSSDDQRQQDIARAAALELAGVRIIRFTATQALYDTANVMRAVMDVLGVHRPIAAWKRRHELSLAHQSAQHPPEDEAAVT